MKKIIDWKQIQPSGVYVVKLSMRNWVPPDKMSRHEKNMIYTYISGLTGVDRIHAHDSYFDFVSATPEKLSLLRQQNEHARRVINDVLIKLIDAQPVTLRVPGTSLLTASSRLSNYLKEHRSLMGNRVSIQVMEEIMEEIDALEA